MRLLLTISNVKLSTASMKLHWVSLLNNNLKNSIEKPEAYQPSTFFCLVYFAEGIVGFIILLVQVDALLF